jgi:hypothetical protein
MNRTVPVLLIVLVLASSFGGYEAWRNSQLQTDNNSLKQQLDDTATQLRAAQDEQTRLENRLNQTQMHVTQLEMKIQQLEQNITELQDQNLRNGAIIIPLIFLWNSAEDVNVTYLRSAVHSMNQIWHSLHIYFTINETLATDWIPYNSECSNTEGWVQHMQARRKILVGLFLRLWTTDANLLGCTWPQDDTVGIVYPFASADPFRNAELVASIGANLGSTLSHEMLHILGVSDDELRSAGVYYDTTFIPMAWTTRVRIAAAALVSV